ncbi:hypothetical protein Tco_0222421 [Tanacetum coccineum]
MSPRQIKRPWEALWKSKRLMNIGSEISGQMDSDYNVVHVVRGEKAHNKELWPHLDDDTSPDYLVTKVLQGVIQPWSNLYNSTNESFYNFFDRLRSHYKVHLLDDYCIRNDGEIQVNAYLHIGVSSMSIRTSFLICEATYGVLLDNQPEIQIEAAGLKSDS